LTRCNYTGNSAPFCLVQKLSQGAQKANGIQVRSSDPAVTASAGPDTNGTATDTTADGGTDYYTDDGGNAQAANGTALTFRITSTAAPQGNDGPITAIISGRPTTVGEVAAAILALPADQRRYLSDAATAIIQSWAQNSTFSSAPLDSATLTTLTPSATDSPVDLTSALTNIALMQQRGVVG
ncbi:hypothetical protein VaNZ11_011979, partial [Volvox africanus]